MFIEVNLFKVRLISHALFHDNTDATTYYVLAQNKESAIRIINESNGAWEIKSIKEVELFNGIDKETYKIVREED